LRSSNEVLRASLTVAKNASLTGVFFRRPQSGYAGLSLAVRVEGDPAPVGHRQAAKGSVSPAVRVRSLSNGREEPSVEPDSMPCRTREHYTQRTMPSRQFASAPVLSGIAPWLLDYRPLLGGGTAITRHGDHNPQYLRRTIDARDRATWSCDGFGAGSAW
jgi:hypothetical protein